LKQCGIKASEAELDAMMSYAGAEGEDREKLEEVKQKLIQLLEGVLHSDVKQKSLAQTDAAKRLQKKIETASEQIVELLDGAPQTREQCDALLTELELLKNLVNPDDDKNRFFKSTGQGGSDRCGDKDDERDEDGYGADYAEEEEQQAAQASGLNW